MNRRSRPPTQPVSEPVEQDDAIIGRALRWSLAVLLILASGGGALAFYLTREPPAPTTGKAIVRQLDVRKPQIKVPRIPFVDITDQAGIDFTHENGAYGDKLFPETMGGGCAFFDYDSDGDADLLLVNSTFWPWDEREGLVRPSTRLFANDGTGNFTDVSEKVGLDVDVYGMGAATADYDNDGDVDVFLSCVGRNRMYRNDGGVFVEVTDEAGVGGDPQQWGTSCAFFDYDNDGLLDLFVCNYVTWSKELDVSQAFQLVGIGRAYGPPISFQGTLPFLYHNEGGGRFRDVSSDTGVEIKNRLTGVPLAKSLGVAPADLDRDGWIDLVVANDTVQNFLFHNQQGKGFQEIGAISGVAFDSAGGARGAMGIDIARYRNTEDLLGIAIGNFANEMAALYVAEDDPLQFFDAAVASGLGPQTRLELTFGLFFFDCDLDGRLDLLTANGHLEADVNRVIAGQTYEQPPQLFWNAGLSSSSEFLKATDEAVGPELLKPMVGRGAAYADIDGDGDLDVLITAIRGRPRLLRNDQAFGHHWLRFRLTGSRSNRDAIGAWIEVQVGNQTIRRQVMPARSYLSQVELPVTIGLGTATDVDQVTITWPSGLRQEVDVTEVDRTYEVSEQE